MTSILSRFVRMANELKHVREALSVFSDSIVVSFEGQFARFQVFCKLLCNELSRSLLLVRMRSVFSSTNSFC